MLPAEASSFFVTVDASTMVVVLLLGNDGVGGGGGGVPCQKETRGCKTNYSRCADPWHAPFCSPLQ